MTGTPWCWTHSPDISEEERREARSRGGQEAQKQLAAKGVAARVVSVPCLDLLLELPAAERKALIGNAPVKIAVEAAVRQGWDAVVGADGLFVGMTSFGASAPAKDLYRHFGITAEAVVNAALGAGSAG